jgi:hypothetical protein
LFNPAAGQQVLEESEKENGKHYFIIAHTNDNDNIVIDDEKDKEKIWKITIELVYRSFVSVSQLKS